jgi:CTD small phosphatase-like protein 2
MDKNLMSPGGLKAGLPNSPLIPMDEHEDVTKTPIANKERLDRSQMSPMHPPRPLVIHEEEEQTTDSVGRKVDALFSPVLNFLGKEGEEEPAADDGATKPAASEGTSKTAHETISTSHTEEEEAEEAESEEYHDSKEFVETEEDRLVEDDGSSQESYDDDEFNPYVFIKSLPAYDMVAPLRPPVALPPKAKDAPPISLVLDLDETLVHCTVEPVEDADLVFPVDFHGMTYQVHVRLRPYLFEFLEKIKGKYEVILFTASQKVYANELLNLIDPGTLLQLSQFSAIKENTLSPNDLLSFLFCFGGISEGKYIQHRMYRESCLAVEGNFLKDLNVLGRDLSKSVLVDNSPHAFGYQVDNGIPIESWFDDPKDTELKKLERFLRTLHGVKDLRTVIRKTFQTHRLVEES